MTLFFRFSPQTDKSSYETNEHPQPQHLLTRQAILTNHLAHFINHYSIFVLVPLTNSYFCIATLGLTILCFVFLFSSEGFSAGSDILSISSLMRVNEDYWNKGPMIDCYAGLRGVHNVATITITWWMKKFKLFNQSKLAKFQLSNEKVMDENVWFYYPPLLFSRCFTFSLCGQGKYQYFFTKLWKWVQGTKWLLYHTNAQKNWIIEGQ